MEESKRYISSKQREINCGEVYEQDSDWQNVR